MNTNQTTPGKIDLRTLKPTGTQELEKTILEAIRRDEIRRVRKKAAFYGLCAGSVLGAIAGSAAMLLGILFWPTQNENTATLPEKRISQPNVTEIQNAAKPTVDFPDLRFPELENLSQRIRIVESSPKPAVSHESFVNRQRQNTLLIREILENKTSSENGVM